MNLYATTQPDGNPSPVVRCAKCARPSKGYWYCFPCRRAHAKRQKVYQAARRLDPAFVAAERIATRERMRRLRAQRRQKAGGSALVEGGDVR